MPTYTIRRLPSRRRAISCLTEACTAAFAAASHVASSLTFTVVFTIAITVPLTASSTASAQAQQAGRVSGTVHVDGGDLPLPGVHVFIENTAIGTVTDAGGRFALERVPVGPRTIVARFVGFETVRQPVEVSTDTTTLTIVLEPSTERLDGVVVTATGERQSRANVAATVQSVDGAVIDRVKPAHPSEIMGRLPGVWVNTTSGEGHMTAIRQPLTTDAVYLYLENGVPTRSTGFFNHNALYELNVPMAENIEVLKGPGSALYGSDAVGGVVNVSTGSTPEAPMAHLTMEAGSDGYGRAMLRTGTSAGRHGLRLDVLATKSDGWRDASRFDRQSGILTWDAGLNGTARLRTVATFSVVDQEPAGSAAISREDYETSPMTNYTPISFRDVMSVRVASAYERITPAGSISLTPFARLNRMSILPNWSLAYDPSVYSTDHSSIGVLARYRHDFDAVGLRLIAGIDAEQSPGEHVEHRIAPERTDGIYTSYVEAELLYDYDVTFRETSPYLHAEFAPFARMRLTGGLRADLLSFDYDNRLSVVTDGPHRRAADTRLIYRHLSPKLGATYRLSDAANVFASFRHAFRVPSEGQLFRQGSTTNTLDLEPVKADQFEVGLRLRPTPSLHVDVSAYDLRKTNDLVTVVDENGVRISTNAGATSHQGVEAGITVEPADGLHVTASYAHAVHRYEDWHPSPATDFSGHEMEAAPRSIAFAELAYRPPFASGLSLSAEARRLGSYWMDPANSAKYDGHTVIGLRAQIHLPAGFAVFGRITNLTDARYAERATFDVFRGAEFAPARPRAVFVGVRFGAGAA